MKQLHIGTVTRNTDETLGSELRGAVYFESATLTGGKEYPEPIQPCFPFAAKDAGMFFVPDVGDVIEVELDVDNPDYADPKYRCGLYSTEDDIDELFKINYPKRSGWTTKSGHYFVFDDTDGKEMLKLGHALLGTSLTFDATGNWLEEIVRSKVTNILKDHNIDIAGNQTVNVEKNRDISVKNNETHTTEGDFTHVVKGDYILQIQGSYKPQYSDEESNPKQITQITDGFRKYITGGGYTHEIGGSKSEAIVSNSETTIGGQETKLVTLNSENVYGTGYKATVALGNHELILTLGNMLVNIIAGNIALNTAAGNIDLSTLAGEAKFGTLLAQIIADAAGGVVMSNAIGGKVEVDPTGNVNIDGSVGVFLGGAGLADIATAGILTFENNPVVDSITGSPSIGSFKVFAK